MERPYPEKVIELAAKVREFTEFNRYKYGWQADLQGACACASFLLARVYQRHRYRARIVVGLLEHKVRIKPLSENLKPHDSEHAWVELEGPIIVDVTATQFGTMYPRVLITSPNQDYWNDYIPLARSQKAVETVIEEWGWSRGHLMGLRRDWFREHPRASLLLPYLLNNS